MHIKRLNLFNGKYLWNTYGLTPDYMERIEIIRNLIPDGVNTLLDIGCGNGDVINAISTSYNKMTIVGADLSHEALRFVKTPAVLAVLPNLPFPQHSFDIVFCLQVLEHMNDKEHFESLREIQRIAKHYIIIGVPFEENLMTKQVLCANCLRISHGDGHLRRYIDSDIKNLFGDFTVVKKMLIGVWQKRASKTGIWLKQKIAGIYYKPELFLCPHCGSNKSIDWKFKSHVFIRKFICFFDKLLTDIRRPTPYWMITLYQRNK